MTEHVVIVGGGHAGGQAAIWLRQYGFTGNIDLISAENWHPYQRPPLSKQVLDGSMSPERCLFRPPEFYADKDISVRLGETVVDIDAVSRTIALESGDAVKWDRAILATGSQLRRLPVQGNNLPGVFYLRNMEDSLAIGSASVGAKRAVVIGGGYIGLEIASSLRNRGLDVTVVELTQRLLQRVVPEMISQSLQELHESRGVRFCLGHAATLIAGDDAVSGVVLDDGTELDADIVVIGIGVTPNTALAEAIGATTDGGIVVDRTCETSVEGVYAVGDCTVFHHRVFGEGVHLESVQNAVGQAKVVAQNLTGTPATYEEVPWFWSDQHGAKLQIAGLTDGEEDLVVRGEMSPGEFSVFATRGGHVQAVFAMGRPKDYLAGRQLIATRTPVLPDVLSDPRVDLKSLGTI